MIEQEETERTERHSVWALFSPFPPVQKTVFAL